MDSEIFLIGLRIVLIIAAGILTNHVLQLLINKLNNKGTLPNPLYPPLRGITKWFLIVLVVILIFHQLGIPLTRILTSLSGILVLVAIGFVAVWSVLSNILSSFLLLVFPPFRFGDLIEIKDPDKEKGFIGKVVGLNIFYTTLQDVSNNKKNTRISVPNNIFFQRIIICHEGSDTSKLRITKDLEEK